MLITVEGELVISPKYYVYRYIYVCVSKLYSHTILCSDYQIVLQYN